MKANRFIADTRMKYFDRFIGVYIDESNREKNHAEWLGMTPEEAMQLADKVTAWVASDLKLQSD